MAHFKVVPWIKTVLLFNRFFLICLMHPVSPEWNCCRRKFLLAFVLKLNICRIIIAIKLLNFATQQNCPELNNFSFLKINSTWMAESDYINWYLGQTQQKSQFLLNTEILSTLVLKYREWIHARMTLHLESFSCRTCMLNQLAT